MQHPVYNIDGTLRSDDSMEQRVRRLEAIGYVQAAMLKDHDPRRVDAIVAAACKPLASVLQIDGFVGMHGDDVMRADDDGDAIMYGLQDELRNTADAIPVRVQISPNARPADVLRILDKMRDTIANGGVFRFAMEQRAADERSDALENDCPFSGPQTHHTAPSTTLGAVVVSCNHHQRMPHPVYPRWGMTAPAGSRMLVTMTDGCRAHPLQDRKEHAMYMRIVRGRVQPGQLDAFVTRWREGIGDHLPSVPGFRHGHFGADRQANTVTGVTLWDAPPDEAMNRRIQEFAEQVRDLMAGPPEIEDYEILVEV